MTAGRLHVCVAQPGPPPESAEQALERVERLFEAAPDADLVVLPELALCGYGDAARVRRLAAGRHSALVERLRAVAAKAGKGLIAGFAEREDDTLYNAALAIDPAGDLRGIYRKVNLWGDYENTVFTAGAPSPVIDWDGFRVGLLICHDLDFPESARDLASRGADTLVVLSATNARYHVIPDVVAPARAYENTAYLIYADAAGPDGPFSFLGHSRIIAPDGSRLASLSDRAPDLTGAVLSREVLDDCRARHPYLANRRSTLYAR